MAHAKARHAPRAERGRDAPREEVTDESGMCFRDSSKSLVRETARDDHTQRKNRNRDDTANQAQHWILRRSIGATH